MIEGTNIRPSVVYLFERQRFTSAQRMSANPLCRLLGVFVLHAAVTAVVDRFRVEATPCTVFRGFNFVQAISFRAITVPAIPLKRFPFERFRFKRFSFQ